MHKEKIIRVKSVEDLNKIRKINQKQFKTLVLKLDDDIFFDEYESFEPIDASDMDVIILGNNHHVQDLYIDKKDDNEVGLFSRTKDFKIFNIGSVTYDVRGKSFVGGLVGKVDGNALVYNVGSYGNIDGDYYCGGFFGTVKDLYIISSFNIFSYVMAKDVVGGIAGMCNKYTDIDSSLRAGIQSVIGKYQGLITGYNSSEMLESILPYIDDNPENKEKKILGFKK